MHATSRSFLWLGVLASGTLLGVGASPARAQAPGTTSTAPSYAAPTPSYGPSAYTAPTPAYALPAPRYATPAYSAPASANPTPGYGYSDPGDYNAYTQSLFGGGG